MKIYQRTDYRLTSSRFINTLNALLILLLAAGLTACGGSSGPLGGLGDNVSNGDAQPDITTVPATFVLPEVALFRDTVYNGKDGSGKSIGILRKNCKNCHINGNTSPAFADLDVNVAYASIFGKSAGNGEKYADLVTPADSRLESKVASGHNCWSTDCAADAADMASQIQDWIDAINGVDTGGGGGGTPDPVIPVKLVDTLVTPEVINEPTASKALPEAGIDA